MPEVLECQRAGRHMADESERSMCTILFVCTGNTCRSPLAEALCKKLLADALGCPPVEVAARGFQVVSAGLAALPGGPASLEAVSVAKEFGLDLGGHLSQPLTEGLIQQADYIVGMTRHHLRFLEAVPIREGLVPRLLAADASDISDPLGGALADYRACAEQIYQGLKEFLLQLQQNGKLPNPSGGADGR